MDLSHEGRLDKISGKQIEDLMARRLQDLHPTAGVCVNEALPMGPGEEGLDHSYVALNSLR